MKQTIQGCICIFSHVGNCMEMEQNWKGDEFDSRIICAYAENYVCVCQELI